MTLDLPIRRHRGAVVVLPSDILTQAEKAALFEVMRLDHQAWLLGRNRSEMKRLLFAKWLHDRGVIS